MTTQKPPPLWPRPIPVLGVTGAFESGKTVFLLSISPGSTLLWDWEQSSATYEGVIPFTRVDVTRCGKAKPVDQYLWWLENMRAVPAGKYRVGAIDPVNGLESGLCDWLMKNPGTYGRTFKQYMTAAGTPSGLFWGDVKTLWESHLLEMATKFETVAFSTHLGNDYAGGNAPSGKKKPKGKESLMKLATLYLWLDRSPNAKGAKPVLPSAVVLKSRLSSGGFVDGVVKLVPALPPRLPRATADEIRRYMLAPPDYSKLPPEEMAPDVPPTETELLELRRAAAEAESEASRLRHAKPEADGATPQDQFAAAMHRVANTPAGNLGAMTEAKVEATAAGKTVIRQQEEQRPQATPASPPAPAPSTSNGETCESPAKSVAKGEDLTAKAGDELLGQLATARKSAIAAKGWDTDFPGQAAEAQAWWQSLLKEYGATSAKTLNRGQVYDLLNKLSHISTPELAEAFS